MDGMILAAGLGSRLRPITDGMPKALIPVHGVPMLERVARRMIEAGVDRIIVNVHHCPDQIEEFVLERGMFGIEVLFSPEPERPLDTGGGIKKAAPLFRRDRPILIHNVDVISSVDLRALVDVHQRSGALATLAVRQPPVDRYLLVSTDDRFCGYGDPRRRRSLTSCDAQGPLREVEFCGIQVIAPAFIDLTTEEGVFSTIYVYARLAEEGRSIRAFDIGDALWIDVGTVERLEYANRVAPA